MTAADCKTYMDAAAKDAKMKNADKDAQCKAMADKAAADKAEEVDLRQLDGSLESGRAVFVYRTFSPARDKSCAVSNSGRPITPE